MQHNGLGKRKSRGVPGGMQFVSGSTHAQMYRRILALLGCLVIQLGRLGRARAPNNTREDFEDIGSRRHHTHLQAIENLS